MSKDVGPAGLKFTIASPWGRGTIESGLIGRFNASNLLATLGVLLVSDVPLRDALGALAKVKPVSGRTERYGGGIRPLVVVDYAHTPDALENVLRALRDLMSAPVAKALKRTRRSAARKARSRKLVCVFGCGGDRDATKRPVMGAIAERLADRVIVTDDNPRTEDGDAIVADILNGMKSADRVLIERDRAIAIERAIREASANDAVLIAGKGHEDYQIVGLVSRYFSDRDVVNGILRRRA